MIFRTIALAGADERQRANADGSSGTQAGRLGNFPFWRGNEHFLETMDGIYRAAGQAGGLPPPRGAHSLRLLPSTPPRRLVLWFLHGPDSGASVDGAGVKRATRDR